MRRQPPHHAAGCSSVFLMGYAIDASADVAGRAPRSRPGGQIAAGAVEGSGRAPATNRVHDDAEIHRLPGAGVDVSAAPGSHHSGRWCNKLSARCLSWEVPSTTFDSSYRPITKTLDQWPLLTTTASTATHTLGTEAPSKQSSVRPGSSRTTPGLGIPRQLISPRIQLPATAQPRRAKGAASIGAMRSGTLEMFVDARIVDSLTT